MFSRNIKNQATINFPKQLFLCQRVLSSQSLTFNTIKCEEPLDFKSIPRLSAFSFIRHFMPGGEFKNASFYDYALAMHQRMGDIFIIPGMFGKPDVVMVINTKDIETVYRNEGQYPCRQIFESIKYFRSKIKGDYFQQCLGLPVAQGEAWGKMRSAANPLLLKRQNLNIYIKPLQEISDEFISRIKKIRDVKTLEVDDNFETELTRLTFESVCLVALNHKLGMISRYHCNPIDERLIKCAQLHFDNSFKLDIQPSLWKVIRTSAYYKSMKTQQDLCEITCKYADETLKLLKEKQQRGEDDENVLSVLEKLLLIDKNLAVVVAMDMLVAGIDITTVTLISLLLCLAKHPEKQQKLREEILKIMPTKETVLNENNLKNLPYLKAVVKETLRYYPNGAGIIRAPVDDVILSGYKVPKNSMIALNTNCLMKNEAFFPQADQFLPERWLRDERKNTTKIDPFSFIPFGMGPRSCIGKRLAELEIELIVLKLLRNFEIEFNYDASKPFKGSFLNVPDLPLRFTFKDVKY